MAEVAMNNGKQASRLPSVKARSLWHADNNHFDWSKTQDVPGRVETSANFQEHPLRRTFGLKAVPMAIYGDCTTIKLWHNWNRQRKALRGTAKRSVNLFTTLT